MKQRETTLVHLLNQCIRYFYRNFPSPPDFYTSLWWDITVQAKFCITLLPRGTVYYFALVKERKPTIIRLSGVYKMALVTTHLVECEFELI